MKTIFYRLLPIFVALAPSLGYGQTLSPYSLQTTKNLTLFVDSHGKDGNNCLTSGSGACATIQGAVNKVPKFIRHAVNISVTNEAYATGAYVEGFNCAPGFNPTTGQGSYLRIFGQLANFAPATGTATGTATAAASNGTGLATITDGAQAWTVDNLRGSLIKITGGTGSGQIFMIKSNTATVITVAANWATTPDVTSTYAIQRPATSVTGGLSLPFAPVTATNPSATATANYASFIVDGVRTGATIPTTGSSGGAGSGNGSCVYIDQISYTSATARAVEIRNSSGVAVRFSKMANSAANSEIQLSNAQKVWVQSNYAQPSAEKALVGQTIFEGLSSLNLNGNVGDGGALMSASDSGTTQNGWAGGMISNRNSWKGTSQAGIFALGFCVPFCQLQFDLIEQNTTGPCVGAGGPNIAPTDYGTGGNLVLVGGTYGGCVDGIKSYGAWIVSQSATVVAGAGNSAFGVNFANGARGRFATRTITGASGDFTIDNTNPLSWTADLDAVADIRNVMNDCEVTNSTTEPNKGRFYTGLGDGSGTSGSQTQNASNFKARFAAAASALTVTNSMIKATSTVTCTLQTADATAFSVSAVPAAGSVLLTTNAAATAATVVGCTVWN